MVLLLLSRGADAAAVDGNGCVPLHAAAEWGRAAAAAALIDVGGADIAARDADGRTALHLAAQLPDERGGELLGDGDAAATVRALLAPRQSVYLQHALLPSIRNARASELPLLQLPLLQVRALSPVQRSVNCLCCRCGRCWRAGRRWWSSTTSATPPGAGRIYI